jgi:2'-5' RNA ligase
MSGVRLFVAVELPEAERAELARWAADAVGDEPAVRLARADALHLTLAFLGHRPPQEVEGIIGVVRGAPAAAVPLTVGDAAWFDPRRPRVLTALLRDDRGALATLHDAVWSGLEPLGFVRERRRFRPHVTVGRVRHGMRPARLELPVPPPLAFAAEALTLFRSHLGGGPARYEALERLALG